MLFPYGWPSRLQTVTSAHESYIFLRADQEYIVAVTELSVQIWSGGAARVRLGQVRGGARLRQLRTPLRCGQLRRSRTMVFFGGWFACSTRPPEPSRLPAMERLRAAGGGRRRPARGSKLTRSARLPSCAGPGRGAHRRPQSACAGPGHGAHRRPQSACAGPERGAHRRPHSALTRTDDEKAPPLPSPPVWQGRSGKRRCKRSGRCSGKRVGLTPPACRAAQAHLSQDDVQTFGTHVAACWSPERARLAVLVSGSAAPLLEPRTRAPPHTAAARGAADAAPQQPAARGGASHACRAHAPPPPAGGSCPVLIETPRKPRRRRRPRATW